MRYQEIVEVREMNIEDALRHFGISHQAFSMMSLDELKNIWKQKVKNAHPDNPENRGKNIDVGSINAAYDSLKKAKSQNPEKPQQSSERPSSGPRYTDEEVWGKPKDQGGIPPWQTDIRSSHNGISKHDFSDGNYFKMIMWQKSGSRTPYTLWAFDGHFFRSSITVFANRNIFRYMIEAMMVYNRSYPNNYKTRAIFYSTDNEPQKIYLIYSDEKYYLNDPIMFEHDSFNSNPSNDQQFTRKLPDYLDEIKRDQ